MLNEDLSPSGLVSTPVSDQETIGSRRLWNEIQGDWYVLHIKSRQEKALFEQVQSVGLSLYLPLWPQVRFYGKRKKKVELPLFPGYAFLKGDYDAVIQADRTKRLVNFIKVPDQDMLAWELAGIDALLQSGQPFAEHQGLKVGQRVSVRSGPMKGVQGWVESLEKSDRLVIQIETLGRAVSVEVDVSLVDLVVN